MTAVAGDPDLRVPGYLGRVLDADGDPAGTCFQVAHGVLVTAWHVLDEIGAAEVDAGVRVDPLAGGVSFDATVVRLDPVTDLAVLTCARGGLAACSGPLAASGEVRLRTLVTVTGHVVPEDSGHSYRYLDAAGEWAGGTTRDDSVPLGCLTSHRVLRGMSGAPVIRDGDGHVVVVSGRYNSADGWLRDTVWLARTEDLLPLLTGITSSVAVELAAVAGAADLTLTVTGRRVRLTGPGVDMLATHGGVRPGLAAAVQEVRRVRARAGQTLGELQAAGQPGELSLARAGRLLAESFLPPPVAAELGKVVQAAERAHQLVRIGLEVPRELAWLPWECLRGPWGGPLALHRLISVYRQAETAPARVLPGPLRIVVAIAAPDDGGG